MPIPSAGQTSSPSPSPSEPAEDDLHSRNVDAHPAPVVQRLCLLLQDLCLISESIMFYKEIVHCWSECMKSLRLLLQETRGSSTPMSVDEVSNMHTLEAVCLKMKEHLEKCSRKACKTLPLLVNQRILKAFSELSMDFKSSLRLLPLNTLEVSDHSVEQVEQCSNQLETLNFCMNSLEETLHEQIETVLMEIKKGVKLNHTTLIDIATKLDLKSNQEILREASLLEKEKKKAQSNNETREEELIDLLIILVTQMADDLIERKQLIEHEHKVSIPADFRCPLSLELMADPVIVASGQTYERSCIEEWFNEGNTSCPKSRQQLPHMNLIPNYNVKYLITSWLESNHASLPPDPEKPDNDVKLTHGTSDEPLLDGLRSVEGNSVASQIPQDAERSCTSKDGKYLSCGKAGVLEDLGDSRNETFNARDASSLGASALQSNLSGYGYVASSSSALYTNNYSWSSLNPDNCGSVPSKRGTLSNSSNVLKSVGLQVEPNLAGGDEFAFHLQVQALVKDLYSPVADAQSIAVKELRLLSKHNTENRILIAKCGGVLPLVSLLHSPDPEIQENAVTTLLNLLLNDNNKAEISAANPIDSLVHVLGVGTPAARENAAAALFTLCSMEENRTLIGESEAIPLLIDLLVNGSPRGKKDAITALCTLSLEPRNKLKLVRSNAVKPLVALMCDPAIGLVDKAVQVIRELTHITEGLTSVGEVHGGIPGLVEVVETGSQRGKESATTALLRLCSHSMKFRMAVLQEGAIPPLAALARSGTPRGKAKAENLLRILREQNQGRRGANLDQDDHLY